MGTAEKLTSNNTGLTLNVGLNYGGKQDIVQGAKNLFKKLKSGIISEDQINEDIFRNSLPSSHVSDVDLLIRTSGENRLSNFMLWQNTYAEMYFTNKLWPEFFEKDLDDAINLFSYRDRRFGSTAKFQQSK